MLYDGILIVNYENEQAFKGRDKMCLRIYTLLKKAVAARKVTVVWTLKFKERVLVCATYLRVAIA